MRKFLTSQAVQRLARSDTFFQDFLPFYNTSDAATSVLTSACMSMDESTLCTLNFHHDDLTSITSFDNNGIVVPHPPFHEKSLILSK